MEPCHFTIIFTYKVVHCDFVWKGIVHVEIGFLSLRWPLVIYLFLIVNSWTKRPPRSRLCRVKRNMSWSVVLISSLDLRTGTYGRRKNKPSRCCCCCCWFSFFSYRPASSYCLNSVGSRCPLLQFLFQEPGKRVKTKLNRERNRKNHWGWSHLNNNPARSPSLIFFYLFLYILQHWPNLLDILFHLLAFFFYFLEKKKSNVRLSPLFYQLLLRPLWWILFFLMMVYIHICCRCTYKEKKRKEGNKRASGRRLIIDRH